VFVDVGVTLFILQTGLIRERTRFTQPIACPSSFVFQKQSQTAALQLAQRTREIKALTAWCNAFLKNVSTAQSGIPLALHVARPGLPPSLQPTMHRVARSMSQALFLGTL
jgi:hypothetical protein